MQEMCDSEDSPKIYKFRAKTTLQGHRTGDVNDVQRRSRFDRKGFNCWLIMGVCQDIEIKARLPFCYDGGDKTKIETAAVGDSKKCISEVLLA